MIMKIKCKRVFALLLTSLLILSLAACNKIKDDTQDNYETSSNNILEEGSISQDSDENESQSETVKSDGYTKFSQLEIGMTESDVNAILGEPTKVE